MIYWKYKEIEEVLKIGISKGIDMKLHKTFDLLSQSLAITTVEMPVWVHKEEYISKSVSCNFILVTIGSSKYPSFSE